MRQQPPGHRPRPVPFGRPLLAWRPNPYRGPEELRALFAVHCNRPQLIAAWHRGDSLDAAKAQQLWAAHRWQLISPPADVAALLAADQPLVAISR
jgi:hypothetical protein